MHWHHQHHHGVGDVNDVPPLAGPAFAALTFVTSCAVWVYQHTVLAVPIALVDSSNLLPLGSLLLGWAWWATNFSNTIRARQRQDRVDREATLQNTEDLKRLINYQYEELKNRQVQIDELTALVAEHRDLMANQSVVMNDQARQLHQIKHDQIGVQQTVKAEAEETRHHVEEVIKAKGDSLHGLPTMDLTPKKPENT